MSLISTPLQSFDLQLVCLHLRQSLMAAHIPWGCVCVHPSIWRLYLTGLDIDAEIDDLHAHHHHVVAPSSGLPYAYPKLGGPLMHCYAPFQKDGVVCWQLVLVL